MKVENLRKLLAFTVNHEGGDVILDVEPNRFRLRYAVSDGMAVTMNEFDARALYHALRCAGEQLGWFGETVLTVTEAK